MDLKVEPLYSDLSDIGYVYGVKAAAESTGRTDMAETGVEVEGVYVEVVRAEARTVDVTEGRGVE